MRTMRGRRRNIVDVRRISIGDIIVLLASLFALVSLFLPWFSVGTPRPHDEWAFTYSEVASVVVIVFFLATLLLAIYPSLSPELRFPPLPFSTPLVFLAMGALMVLIFVYEVGKYGCIDCSSVNRGYGVWLGLIASFVYVVGAIIRWGSRPARRQ